MVYPFLLMVSSSLTSHVDFQEFALVPGYLYDENMLMFKYLLLKMTVQGVREGEKFSDGILQKFNNPLGSEAPDFQLDKMLEGEGTIRRIQDWYAFKTSLPLQYTMPYFLEFTPYYGGPVLERYRRFLQGRYNNDIQALNHAYGEASGFFGEVAPPYIRQEYIARMWKPENTLKAHEWSEFRKTLSREEIQTISGEEIYQIFLRERKYATINDLNKAYGADYEGFWSIRLPEMLPKNPAIAADWVDFVRSRWPLRFLKLTKGEPEYREFLRTKYATIDAYNEKYGARVKSFDEMPFVSTYPWVYAGEDSRAADDWARFVRYAAPADGFQLETTEGLYRRFLDSRYAGIAALNQAYGTSYASFEDVTPPYLECSAYEVRQHPGRLRWEYATRSYRIVVGQMLLHGRAFLNTFVLVAAIMIAQLTINPFAAFALSKLHLPFTRHALLFLIGTMAFPEAVGMIPNFLLLRELHLLNTYWALILPAAANGYAIFVLKSFFDGLPRELFEYCTLEGGGPLRQFWHVALPLNKPIFAVIALGAFGMAYGSFMWAFVVCQKESMWTLMVWLQQFQVRWGTGPIMMAGLVLAGIPTLLVFMFCQRIIIRGIPLPTFK
jgi:multiple sugar transport system permease protein